MWQTGSEIAIVDLGTRMRERTRRRSGNTKYRDENCLPVIDGVDSSPDIIAVGDYPAAGS